ncbi:MAG TPA: DUF2795 domain-containing protein [Ktedonobacteraceae bacterium]|nr:DUF2795 domain-containing protein [Ktedonobacteraceae bacterium]
MADTNPIQIEKFLKGADYPASKEDLIRLAQQNGADERVRVTLQRLPDKQYGSPADVSKAVGAINRRH